MAGSAKQNVRTIYKLGAFLAFLMLGYLGIRSYRLSVEQLKTNGCINEIGDLVANIQNAYLSQTSYKGLEYKTAVAMKLIPQNMFKEGFKEAVNSYLGGVDLYQSSLNAEDDYKAFEVSFQGLSSIGCVNLMRMPWDEGQNISFIAVGGYGSATPSGVLDLILSDTPQSEIKNKNIFKSSEVRLVDIEKIEAACNCPQNTCSVVWKFR